MTRERLGNVLVVGDNDMAGLTTVRSLGRSGLDVHLVAFEPGSVTRASRYVRRVHHLGHPLEDPAAFRERFLALVRRTRFDLALPTSDPALVTLMPCREEVERCTRLAVPDPAGFTATNDKAETIRLAQQLGIPVPRTQLFRSPADLPLLQGPFAFPLVLKPSRTVLEGRTERNLVKVVHCEEDLRDRLAILLQRCPTLVQEFCPGFGAGLSVLADRGELVAAFQHERVHEPPQGGAASYRRSVPLSPALLEAARGFCREIRWTGPAMFEFKVCPETGRAVLMEVNGRLWGSLALAVHAGVDFPRLIYDLLVCGRARPTFSYRVPCYVRHTRLDAEWLWDNFRAPRGRPDLLRKGAGQILSELANVCRGQEGYDLESLSDPLPGFLSWIWVARHIAAGAGRWLGRRWHAWQFSRQGAQVRRPGSAADERLRRARSVLFVCHGNINRSAVAEQVLRQQCRERGWALRVASAGLLPQAGRPTGPVSREVATSLGVDLSGHRSTPLTAELLREFDLVLVMEAAHLAGVRALEPQAVAKTFPLASFRDQCGALQIGDPEGRERGVFRTVYEGVVGSVEGLVHRLEQGRTRSGQASPGRPSSKPLAA
jgi:protein-tyrosine-phosphatase/predicted ATP-grasp superfamily ATP-dependent carboligase